MKAPNLADIPTATPATSFDAQAKAIKKREAKAPKKDAPVVEKVRAIRKSYSVNSDHVSYIEKLSLELGNKRGKSMTESEALRVIIQAHVEGKK